MPVNSSHSLVFHMTITAAALILALMVSGFSPAISLPGGGSGNSYQVTVGTPEGPAPRGEVIEIPVRVSTGSDKGYFYLAGTSVTFPSQKGFDCTVRIESEVHDKKDQFSGEMIKVYAGEFTATLLITPGKDAARGKSSLTGSISHQACVGDLCLMPGSTDLGVTVEIAERPETAAAAIGQAPVKPAGETRDDAVTRPGRDQDIFSKGYPYMLFAMFMAGLAASMTPCIWPMIPVTVGILGSLSGGGRLKGFLYSLVYVLGISVTYSVMGVVAATSGAAFGEFSNHPAVLAVVAAVFLLFGLSMFDLFDIQLSGELTAKFQQRRQGVLGVMLMGLLAGLVASPCIAPVVGALLAVVAKTGDVVYGALGLAAFAWGLGILFIVLGTFTGIMSYMPRSGMWMVEIKHLFGLIMVACSIYFISPLVGATATAGVAGISLILVAAAGSPISSIREGEPLSTKLRGGVCIAMLILGASTLWNLHSGLIGASDSPQPTPGVMGTPGPSSGGSGADRNTLGGEDWESEVDSAIERAKAENRRVIIDFYADWCVQCKKLDRDVFSSPEFTAATKDFVKVKADMTEREGADSKKLAALREKFGIFGYPRVVFLDSSGKIDENASFNGYMNLQGVLEKIREAR